MSIATNSWGGYPQNDYRSYLEHYGILGMKWGVRRYQNKDGSLTASGKRHNQISDKELTEFRKKKIAEAPSKVDSPRGANKGWWKNASKNTVKSYYLSEKRRDAETEYKRSGERFEKALDSYFGDRKSSKDQYKKERKAAQTRQEKKMARALYKARNRKIQDNLDAESKVFDEALSKYMEDRRRYKSRF